MRVFRKFRASDGRIKIATLSGVSALVAVIAMLVGVLPVFAGHGGEHPLVDPGDPIQYGGGSGACEFVEVDSDANEELHDNNPSDTTLEGSDGTEIKIVITGQTFSFEVLTPGMAVYDVVVNGGPHNNHYDYDDDLGEPVTYDEGLHAPEKNNDELNNLSHINICYDFDTQFECGVTQKRDQDGVFTLAEVTIFANSLWSCEDKLGAFAVDNGDDPHTLIDFGTGEGTVAGMATFTKDFGEGTPPFVPLKYSQTAIDTPVEVSWCDIRNVVDNQTTSDLVVINDGEVPVNPFSEWLPDGKYPKLDGVTDGLNLADGALACKVYEEEDISGIQFTVVYFEFEDPLFR